MITDSGNVIVLMGSEALRPVYLIEGCVIGEPLPATSYINAILPQPSIEIPGIQRLLPSAPATFPC